MLLQFRSFFRSLISPYIKPAESVWALALEGGIRSLSILFHKFLKIGILAAGRRRLDISLPISDRVRTFNTLYYQLRLLLHSVARPPS